MIVIYLKRRFHLAQRIGENGGNTETELVTVELQEFTPLWLACPNIQGVSCQTLKHTNSNRTTLSSRVSIPGS